MIANKKEMTIQPDWFCGIGAKEEMYRDARKNGHKYYVASDVYANSGSKKFASFVDIDAFLEYEKTIPIDSKNLYEILSGEVVEFYDLDIKEKSSIISKQSLSYEELLEDVIADFMDARTDFQLTFYPDIPLTNDHFLVQKTDDPEGKKASAHITIRNGTKFDNNQIALNSFVKDFHDWLRKQDYCVNYVGLYRYVDMGVYDTERNLRLLGHCKKGQIGRHSYRYPNISTFNDDCDYKLFLAGYVDGSEINYPMSETEKEKKRLEIEKNQKKFKKSQEKSQEEEEENPNIIDELRNWVDILSDSRVDKRDEWIRLCWCLRNLTNKSEEGLELFKYKSSMSAKHDEDACETEWNRKNNREDKLGMGTLINWAKNDDFESYKVLVKKCQSTQESITKSINGSHYDLAELFMRVYGDANIKIISDESLTFYGWNEDKKLWEENSKHKLRKLVCETIVPIFEERARILLNELSNLSRKDSKEGELSAKLKVVNKSIMNLKSAPYLKNVCSFVAGHVYDTDFESKVINKSPFELPIKGCKIINLKTLEVRDRDITDYFSFELDVDFLGKKANFKNVEKFFNDITNNDKDLVDYHRRMWGYMMTGSIKDRSLHIIWGNGCNGKSTIVNIFKKITRGFSVSLDEDAMLKKKSSGATPELMDFVSSRCGFLPESEKREKLNTTRVKTITGGDTISGRHLYGHIVKFETQCKPIFPTNFKPEIDITDQAILDRLKLIPFLNRFPNTKANQDYIEDLKENKIDEFFTWFCTGAFDWINGKELIPCKSMSDEKQIFIKENNPTLEFLEDALEIISKEDYDKLKKVDKEQWKLPKANMYQKYCEYKDYQDTISNKAFTEVIETKIVKIKLNGYFYYLCKFKPKRVTNDDDDDDEDKTSGLPPM